MDASAFVVIDWKEERIHPAAAWFSSERVREALSPVLERPYDRERPGITESAVERGRPLLLERLADWPGATRMRERLEQDLPPAQAAQTWEWYQEASVISAPVTTTDGRTLGVMSVSSSPPHPPLDEEALHLVEVLTDLAAIALDREQLLLAEERRRRQERVLTEAGRAVAESLDPDVVLRRIAEWAAIVGGATSVVVARRHPRLPQLEVVEQIGLAEDLRGTRLGLRDDLAGHDHVRASMQVPLAIGPRIFGVLMVGHERPDFFDAAAVEQLSAFARLAAAAIANAADHQHERRVVHALTRGFVPVEPGALPGVELAVRYEPAEEQLTGGDFYGAWPTDDGCVAVVVGDVSGKGVEAAGLGSMVRFFIEARTLGSSSPAAVLDATASLVAGRLPDDALVTVFFCVLSGSELRYANAGHPAPLLVQASGGCVELAGTGLPLGVDEGGVGERTERVEPGDVLVAFTDGLVEARRGLEVMGTSEVVRMARETGAAAGPQALVDALVEGALGWAGGFADDVTLLALGRR